MILAPVGSSRDVLSARRRGGRARRRRAGTIYTLSTLSGLSARRREDARPAGPAWYQLYLCGGRDVARGAIERARKAGYSAIVVTIDTPVAGLRERDVRNGMKELRHTQSVEDAAARPAVCRASRAGCADSSATAA